MCSWLYYDFLVIVNFFLLMFFNWLVPLFMKVIDSQKLLLIVVNHSALPAAVKVFSWNSWVYRQRVILPEMISVVSSISTSRLFFIFPCWKHPVTLEMHAFPPSSKVNVIWQFVFVIVSLINCMVSRSQFSRYWFFLPRNMEYLSICLSCNLWFLLSVSYNFLYVVLLSP